MKKIKKINSILKVHRILLSLLLFFTTFMYAQEFVVTGNVTDSAGMPIPGVTILVESSSELQAVISTQGTTTDFDGNYSILVRWE